MEYSQQLNIPNERVRIPNDSDNNNLIIELNNNNNIGISLSESLNNNIKYIYYSTSIRRFISIVTIIIFIFIIAKHHTNFWNDIFFYHPLFMLLSFLGIIPELLNSISIFHGRVKKNILRRNLFQIHRKYALIFKIFSTFGIIMIEWSKFSKSKKHFTSWHSIIGFICEASQILEIILGFTMYYSITNQKFSVSQRHLIRFFHRLFGIIVIFTGIIAFFLGMFSNYAIRNFEFAIFRIFFAVLPVILALWAYFGAS